MKSLRILRLAFFGCVLSSIIFLHNVTLVTSQENIGLNSVTKEAKNKDLWNLFREAQQSKVFFVLLDSIGFDFIL